jgi:hypothetical protein
MTADGGPAVERSPAKEIALGMGAGFVASKVMDRVTTAFLDRQSQASKRREKELQEEPSFEKAARMIAAARGQEVGDEQAQRLGQRFHVGLGLSGGVISGFLTARGMNPPAAGILTALGIWLTVDEVANPVLGFTPPATAYPRETHLRGLVGHLAYGAVLGGILWFGRLVSARRSSG